ncbi:MAG: polysaccharide biosynthesis C-terminal domain-containing protein [Gammaproteobacteria bacterium]|nr:polysaccharide biosynthesis C-terminal domain-containing protein [Gammaproteobacteria bacterium]
MALVTVAGSFRIISRPVYLALDVPWLSTVMSAVELTVSVPLVVWGVVAGGVVGAAWALFATSVVLLIIDVAAFTKIVGVGVREAFRLVWRIIVATGIMAGVVSLSLFAMPEASDVISSATRLLASIGAGAASYVASLAALWWLSGRAPGPESLVTGELSRVWPRYR